MKAKAKKTEWFCRALTFVLPQDQADQCHRHISKVLASVLQEVLCSMHQKTLPSALSMLAHCTWLSQCKRPQAPSDGALRRNI